MFFEMDLVKSDLSMNTKYPFSQRQATYAHFCRTRLRPSLAFAKTLIYCERELAIYPWKTVV